MLTDFTPYRALSFDCYGTLIDWETGIRQALQPWAAGRRVGAGADELLDRFGVHENVVETESPTLPYPLVLAESLRRIGADLGVEVDAAEATEFGDERRHLAGVRRLRRRAAAAATAVPADHPVQRRPGVVRPEQPSIGGDVRSDPHRRGHRLVQAQPRQLRPAARRRRLDRRRTRRVAPRRAVALPRSRAGAADRPAVGVDRSLRHAGRHRCVTRQRRPRRVAVHLAGRVRRRRCGRRRRAVGRWARDVDIDPTRRTRRRARAASARRRRRLPNPRQLRVGRRRLGAHLRPRSGAHRQLLAAPLPRRLLVGDDRRPRPRRARRFAATRGRVDQPGRLLHPPSDPPGASRHRRRRPHPHRLRHARSRRCAPRSSR